MAEFKAITIAQVDRTTWKFCRATAYFTCRLVGSSESVYITAEEKHAFEYGESIAISWNGEFQVWESKAVKGSLKMLLD